MPLVSSAWLRERLSDDGIRIVDCRWRLGEPGAGEPLWREGHIPGAAFLDLDRDLAAPPGEAGRHPLPRADDFEAAARRAGIGEDTLVVAYDEAGEGGAARLWWLLRHFGHEEVTVLDGGLRAWREDGGELRAGEERIPAGDFTAASRNDTVTAEELASEVGAPTGGALVDARAPERYRARWSLWTRWRGTSRARSTSRSPSSRPAVSSYRPPSSAPASRPPECGPAAMPSHTAARA